MIKIIFRSDAHHVSINSQCLDLNHKKWLMYDKKGSQ